MRLDAARAFSGRAFVKPVSGTGRKPCWMEARAVMEEERTLFDIRHEAILILYLKCRSFLSRTLRTLRVSLHKTSTR